MSTAIRSTSIDPLLGTTVAGRFVVEKRIGKGAMGAVYRARQRGLDRPVALKVLRRDLKWGPDTVGRFRREAKAMSALTHPNTVRVFDFGATDDGLLFLAMELLDGALCTQLIQDATLTPAVAVHYVQQVLRSIGEAHKKGIVHRDLKPDNIFVAHGDAQGAPTVKVLDFGIAKAIEGTRKLDQFETQDGTVFGTPRYMSPEQAQGKVLDSRSDLYSVGIILYELLSGAPPFVDNDAVVVMAKHIRDQPPPLTCPQEGMVFSRRLEAAVRKALEKNPDARFQTASEFESALSACLRTGRLMRNAGSNVSARALDMGRDTLDRVRHLSTSRRWTMGAAGAALATAMVLAMSPRSSTDAVFDQRAASEMAEGTVQLRTEPVGAEVWRAGKRLGMTPVTVPVTPDQTNKVLIRKDGFVDLSVQLEASDGERLLTMAPLPTVSSGEPVARMQQNEARRKARKLRRQRLKKARARQAKERARAAAAQKAAPSKKATPNAARADSASPYEKF